MITTLKTGWQKPFRGIQLNKTHPLARGLVACWMFNEGTGNKVFDYSGNGYDGTIVGPVWKPGKSGSSLDFDGSDDYISFGKSIFDPALAPWSLAILYKFDALPSAGNDHRLVSDAEQGNFELFYADDDDNLKVFTTPATKFTIRAAVANVWEYAVVVYNGAGNLDAYVNDVQEVSGGNFTFASETNDWCIGNEVGSAGKAPAGLVEAVMVWKRALLATEANWLYREPYTMFEPWISYHILGIEPLAAAPVTLTVQDPVHSHLADTVQPSVLYGLTVQAPVHGSLTDTIAAVRVRQLDLQNAVHSQLSNIFPLVKILLPVIQDTVHGHLVDVVAKTRMRTAAVQDTVHGHLATIPLLRKGLTLTVRSPVHGSIVNTVSLPRHATLSLQDAVHGHIADAVAPVRVRNLAIQEPVHSQVADSVLLTLTRLLVAQDAVHGHLADVPSETRVRLPAVQSSIHGSLASKPSLSAVLQLVLQDTIHGQLADVFALTKGVLVMPVHAFVAKDDQFTFTGEKQSFTHSAKKAAYHFVAKKGG